MKKRILLVDDQAEEIESLRQALGKLAGVWESHYVSSAEAALTLLEKEEFDALITDLKMPGMDGAELLNTVGQRYPKMKRFIMSSFANKALIMNCVMGSHEFLSKPLQPIHAVSSVRRSLALDTWLSNKNVEGFVLGKGKLPMLPATYFELMKQLESPNSSLQAIADIISKDLAITAKLLQLVNSAFFGLAEKVVNPEQAVAMIGVGPLKTLVRAIQVFSYFNTVATGHFSVDRLWAHSMAVAGTAKLLTSQETGDNEMAIESFTAGLLHDAGKLFLAANAAADFEKALDLARRKRIPEYQAEAEALKASHAEVGAYLLGLWGMPTFLVEAAAMHHEPRNSPGISFTPLTAVHIANILVHEQEPNKEARVFGRLDEAYLSGLGLSAELDYWKQKVREGENLQYRANSQTSVFKKPAASPAPDRPVQARRSNTIWQSPAVRSAVLILMAVLLMFFVGRSFWGEKSVTRMSAPDIPARKVTPRSAVPAGKAASEAGRGGSALGGPRSPAPSGAPVEGPPSQAEPPAPSVQAQVPRGPSAPPAKPSPAFKLQGLFYRQGQPFALINGKTVGVGGNVNGAKVVSIGPRRVLLEFKGRPKELDF